MVNLASGKLDCELSSSGFERLVLQADWRMHVAVGDGVPPDLAVHLLALHWNRQHFAFLITYRPRKSREVDIHIGRAR